MFKNSGPFVKTVFMCIFIVIRMNKVATDSGNETTEEFYSNGLNVTVVQTTIEPLSTEQTSESQDQSIVSSVFPQNVTPSYENQILNEKNVTSKYFGEKNYTFDVEIPKSGVGGEKIVNFTDEGSSKNLVAYDVRLYLNGNCTNVIQFSPSGIYYSTYYGSNLTTRSKMAHFTFTCSEGERQRLVIAFSYEGPRSEFNSLKVYFLDKLGAANTSVFYNASGNHFHLHHVVFKKRASRVLDDMSYSLLFAVYVAISVSGGVLVIVWMVFCIAYRCRGEKIALQDESDIDQVRINLDEYDLKKIPRLNLDYVRHETLPGSDNNNGTVNFQPSFVPFDEEVVTISGQTERRNRNSVSIRASSPEEIQLRPRNMQTFSGIDFGNRSSENLDSYSTDFITLEPRRVLPKVTFQGLENPMYKQN